jgi:hypothetical protein
LKAGFLLNAEIQILIELKRLHAQLDGIEASLAGRTRRPDRGIVPWRECAAALGITAGDPARAAARRLQRAAARLGGETLRLGRNGAERRGFEVWLQGQTRESGASVIRRALERATR